MGELFKTWDKCRTEFVDIDKEFSLTSIGLHLDSNGKYKSIISKNIDHEINIHKKDENDRYISCFYCGIDMHDGKKLYDGDILKLNMSDYNDSYHCIHLKEFFQTKDPKDFEIYLMMKNQKMTNSGFCSIIYDIKNNRVVPSHVIYGHRYTSNQLFYYHTNVIGRNVISGTPIIHHEKAEYIGNKLEIPGFARNMELITEERFRSYREHVGWLYKMCDNGKFGEKENTAVIVVDPQFGFTVECPEELPVKGTDEFFRQGVNNFTTYMKYSGYRVYVSKDNHPKDHVSFNTWPKHCVENTKGNDIFVDKYDEIFYKGTQKEYDSYSAFYDSPEQQTYLNNLLRDNGIENLIIYGLAGDYCVLETIKDALKFGYNVTAINSLIRCVGQKTFEECVDDNELDINIIK